MLPTPSNSWAVVQWYTWCVLFSMFVTIVLSISISIIHKAGEKYRNVTHVICTLYIFVYLFISMFSLYHCCWTWTTSDCGIDGQPLKIKLSICPSTKRCCCSLCSPHQSEQWAGWLVARQGVWVFVSITRTVESVAAISRDPSPSNTPTP